MPQVSRSRLCPRPGHRELLLLIKAHQAAARTDPQSASQASHRSRKRPWSATEGLNSLQGLVDNAFVASYIASAVKEQTGSELTVDCGAPMRIAKKDDVFSCTTMDAQNTQGSIEITVLDDQGNVNWVQK